MKRVQHGKFKGRSFQWVVSKNPWYVKWLCEQPAGKMVRYFDLITYAMGQDKYAFTD